MFFSNRDRINSPMRYTYELTYALIRRAVCGMLFLGRFRPVSAAQKHNGEPRGKKV